MPIEYETQEVSQQVVVGAECDRCGAEWGVNSLGNLDGGMTVSIGGWYGGTIDDLDSLFTHLVLCDGCAQDFMRRYLPHYGKPNPEREAKLRKLFEAKPFDHPEEMSTPDDS